jgi:hypothetical protein
MEADLETVVEADAARGRLALCNAANEWQLLQEVEQIVSSA